MIGIVERRVSAREVEVRTTSGPNTTIINSCFVLWARFASGGRKRKVYVFLPFPSAAHWFAMSSMPLDQQQAPPHKIVSPTANPVETNR